MHDGVATVEHQGKDAAETTDDEPILYEQHAEPAGFAVRRTAYVYRYRNHLDVARRVFLDRADKLADRLLRTA